MDKLSHLPPEIFEIILPHVGGYGCVSLRRTCKRIKTMVDEMEMRLTPCIWYRYIHNDFSKRCAQSVMLWVKNKEANLKENCNLWKVMYSGLLSSSKRQTSFVCKQIKIPSYHEEPTHIFFAGSQFFIMIFAKPLLCVGLRTALRPDLLLPLTDLRYFDEPDKYPEVRCLDIAHPAFKKHAIFKPFGIVDQSNPIVHGWKNMVQARALKFTKSLPYHEFIRNRAEVGFLNRALNRTLNYAKNNIFYPRSLHIQYDSDSKIVLFSDVRTIYFLHYTSFGHNSEFICSETRLPSAIKSFHRLGNLLVVVLQCMFNNVYTTEMYIDDGGMIHVGKWNRLYFGPKHFAMGEFACDVDVEGNALVIVTDLGNVYLSSIEDTSHKAIQHKLYLAYQLDRSTRYMVSLDLSNGLVIAVVNHDLAVTLLFAS